MSAHSEPTPLHKKLLSPSGAWTLIFIGAVIGVLYVMIHGHANDGMAYVLGAVIGIFIAVIISLVVHSIKVFLNWSKRKAERRRLEREFEKTETARKDRERKARSHK